MLELLFGLFVLVSTVYVAIKIMPTVFKGFIYLIGFLGIVYLIISISAMAIVSSV